MIVEAPQEQTQSITGTSAWIRRGLSLVAVFLVMSQLQACGQMGALYQPPANETEARD